MTDTQQVMIAAAIKRIVRARRDMAIAIMDYYAIRSACDQLEESRALRKRIGEKYGVAK